MARPDRYYLHLLLTLLLAALFAGGCKKEEEGWIPSVTFESPQEGQVFKAGEVIPVRALITDKEFLTFVSVYLADGNFTPLTSARTFTPNAASFQLDTEIWVPEDLQESGTCYVAIRAENNINFKRKYQKLILQTSDAEFKQLLLIGDGGFNAIRVSATGDFTEVNELFTLPGDFAASEISHDDQLLFIAGMNAINVHAYSLEDYSLAWMLDPTPGSPMHKERCLHFNKLLYTTYNFQFIQGYTPLGQVGFSTFIDETDAPEQIIRHEDYILVDMQKKNGDDPFLVTYSAITGNEKQRREIAFDIVGFHPMNSALVMVVGNLSNSGQGIFQLFAPSSNTLISTSFVQDHINASDLTDDGTIILAGNNGIYAVDKALGSIGTIHDKGAQMIAFERLSGSLILGSHLRIEVYEFPGMVHQITLPLSDTLFDMRIHYSK